LLKVLCFICYRQLPILILPSKPPAGRVGTLGTLGTQNFSHLLVTVKLSIFIFSLFDELYYISYKLYHFRWWEHAFCIETNRNYIRFKQFMWYL